MAQISYRLEIYRKLFHILTIMVIPISALFLDSLQLNIFLAIVAAIVLSFDIMRHRNDLVAKIFLGIFSPILRTHEIEKNKLTGASFTCLSAFVSFALFPKLIAVMAFTILAISDSLASLLGRKIKSSEFFEKSVAGSSAFAISAFLILVLYGFIFDQELVFYSFGIFAIFVTTMIEARPSLLRQLDDNLTIPLSFCLTMFLLGAIWNVKY